MPLSFSLSRFFWILVHLYNLVALQIFLFYVFLLYFVQIACSSSLHLTERHTYAHMQSVEA